MMPEQICALIPKEKLPPTGNPNTSDLSVLTNPILRNNSSSEIVIENPENEKHLEHSPAVCENEVPSLRKASSLEETCARNEINSSVYNSLWKSDNPPTAASPLVERFERIDSPIKISELSSIGPKPIRVIESHGNLQERDYFKIILKNEGHYLLKDIRSLSDFCEENEINTLGECNCTYLRRRNIPTIRAEFEDSVVLEMCNISDKEQVAITFFGSGFLFGELSLLVKFFHASTKTRKITHFEINLIDYLYENVALDSCVTTFGKQIELLMDSSQNFSINVFNSASDYCAFMKKNSKHCDGFIEIDLGIQEIDSHEAPLLAGIQKEGFFASLGRNFCDMQQDREILVIFKKLKRNENFLEESEMKKYYSFQKQTQSNIVVSFPKQIISSPILKKSKILVPSSE